MPFSKCHIYQIWHWKMPSGIADIQIGWSEKIFFVRVDLSAIYRAKISLDLSISASPHWLDLVLLGGEILHANLLRRSVYGPIYLLGQKLGFDPKFGWDLSQFLGFVPIFGIWPNFWGKIPIFGTYNLLDKALGKRLLLRYYKQSRWQKMLWGMVQILHEKLCGVQNYFLRKHLLKMDRNFST